MLLLSGNTVVENTASKLLHKYFARVPFLHFRLHTFIRTPRSLLRGLKERRLYGEEDALGSQEDDEPRQAHPGRAWLIDGGGHRARHLRQGQPQDLVEHRESTILVLSWQYCSRIYSIDCKGVNPPNPCLGPSVPPSTHQRDRGR